MALLKLASVCVCQFEVQSFNLPVNSKLPLAVPASATVTRNSAGEPLPVVRATATAASGRLRLEILKFKYYDSASEMPVPAPGRRAAGLGLGASGAARTTVVHWQYVTSWVTASATALVLLPRNRRWSPTVMRSLFPSGSRQRPPCEPQQRNQRYCVCAYLVCCFNPPRAHIIGQRSNAVFVSVDYRRTSPHRGI